MDRLFNALAEPFRRAVVLSLVHGEQTLTTLAAPFCLTMPAVMKHISVLERAGLIKTEKRGRARYCRLKPERLAIAGDWITDATNFWTQRLESLAIHLEREL